MMQIEYLCLRAIFWTTLSDLYLALYAFEMCSDVSKHLDDVIKCVQENKTSSDLRLSVDVKQHKITLSKQRKAYIQQRLPTQLLSNQFRYRDRNKV